MKIYNQTTLQYLGAETAADGAGWYMVAADMAPTQEGALTAWSSEAEVTDWPMIVLNGASQGQTVPTGAWTDYLVEAGFNPAQIATLTSTAADGAVTNVTFGEGVSVTAVTVTDHLSGGKSEMTNATLSLWNKDGQSFDMAFEQADTEFTFTMGGADPQTLDVFIAGLSEAVEVSYHYEGSEGYDNIEIAEDTGGYAKGNGGRDSIYGNDGNDVISLESGEARGGKGDDVISVQESDTLLSAHLYGDEGDDTLTGGARGDQLSGGVGADTIDGGAGQDWVSYVYSKDAVSVDLSTGKGQGGEAEGDVIQNVENVFGSAHNDTINGDANNNHIIGYKGNDTFYASGGNDYIDGHDGFDTVDYSALDAGIIIERSVSKNGYEKITVTKPDGSVDVLRNIETVIGTEHDDTIIGSGDDFYRKSADDTLKGLGGNDTIKGGKGDDVLDGGKGNDTLNGGAGADTMRGGEGTDTASYEGAARGLRVDLQDASNAKGDAAGDSYESIEIIKGSANGEQIFGSAGHDVLHGNGGHDEIKGRGGNDTITAETGNLSGGAGDDTITVQSGLSQISGGTGKDTIYTNAANVIVEGGADADMIDGGTGDTTLSYRGSGEAVYVNLTNGKARGGDATGDSFKNIENLTGSDFNDELRGDQGANRLNGGKGDDILSGAAGSDSLSGGAGVDMADYHYSDAAIKVDLSLQGQSSSGRGAQGADAGGHAAGDVLSGIENVRGSKYDDFIRGSDKVSLRGDELSSAENTLIGGKGDDVLEGLGGADKLIGGSGNDTASYETSDSAVRVDLHAKTATGGDAQGDIFASIENLRGSDYNDVLVGDDGANKLYGGKGNDLLQGGFGGDHFDGGEGTDTVSYSQSHVGVSVNLEKGSARKGDAIGDSFANVENLTGSQHNDILVGDEGNNVLKGLYGHDRLKGGEGSDRLDGGAGDDVLIAGNDGDVLIGGHGDDVFDFSRIEDLSEIATDIIKDFKTGRDSIKLSEAHLGDDNVVTAVETTMNGVKGLALTTNVGETMVNFAFLEGVSSVNSWDFEGDYIPSIDVV